MRIASVCLASLWGRSWRWRSPRSIPRVKAVVEFFGGLPEELQGVPRMPPVLILHGEDDRVVPVSEAVKLQQLLERTGTPYEIKLYPGAGHVLNGLQFMDAGRRAVQFLNKHL